MNERSGSGSGRRDASGPREVERGPSDASGPREVERGRGDVSGPRGERRPAAPPRRRLPRPESLLPLACIAAAVALFASEFMTIFNLTPPGGQALCAQQAASRHHFALGVLAIFAVIAVIVAVLAGSKPAAIAVAACGLGALLLFLIIDLPKANNVGTLGSCSAAVAGNFFEAKAMPQAGFWLEMVGALALALSGAALATMTPEQLATMRPRWLSRSRGATGKQPPAAAASPSAANATPVSEAEQASIGEQEPTPPPERGTRARGTRTR